MRTFEKYGHGQRGQVYPERIELEKIDRCNLRSQHLVFEYGRQHDADRADADAEYPQRSPIFPKFAFIGTSKSDLNP